MKVAPSALVETTYNEMLEAVGGSWPPKSSFEDTWPSLLQPYATLCDKTTDRFVIKILKTDKPDGEETTARIGKKNTHTYVHDPFAKEDIDVSGCPFAKVSKVMASPSETGTRSDLAQQVEDMRDFIRTECTKLAPLEEVLMALSEIDNVKRNGFLTCLAFLLHMFRWGICPIVEYAQLQTSMEFPDKLWIPFTTISDNLGISRSGSIYSIYLCNAIYDNQGNFSRFRFHFNHDKLSDAAIRETEVNFMRLFLEWEKAAGPLYEEMIKCLKAIDNNNDQAAAVAMKAITVHSTKVYKTFRYWLRDKFCKYKYWLRHVQGPAGWSIDEVDGLTGAHTLAIPAMDTFLQQRGNSPTWRFTLRHRSHMTAPMRSFLDALSACRLVDVLNQGSVTAPELYEEYNTNVSRLRGFRLTHKYCVMPYFGVKAPERQPMTAGGGLVVENKYGVTIDNNAKTEDEFAIFFLNRLDERRVETVSEVPFKVVSAKKPCSSRILMLSNHSKILQAFFIAGLAILAYTVHVVGGNGRFLY